MKKTILYLVTASMLLAGGTTNAAKCKFREDSTDKFTKVRTLATNWDPLESLFGKTAKSSGKSIASFVSARSVADEIQLRIRIGLTSYSKRKPPDYELEDAIVIPEGARLLVMMADETIMALFAAKELRVDSTAIPPETGWNITKEYSIEAEAYIGYALDADTIAALTSQGASNMRVEAAETHYDIEIHKKSHGDFKRAIECLQAAL